VNGLQVRVHELRRVLGAGRIASRGSGYMLLASAEELDLLRFDRPLGRAEAALADGRPSEADRCLRVAPGLWRGEPLADLPSGAIAEVECGLLAERRLAAVELQVEAAAALGHHDAVAAELDAPVAEHPCRERFRAQLTLARYRADRQAEALGAYPDARVALHELGLEPWPELRELERAILRHDPSLRVAAADRLRLPATSAPISSGARRHGRRLLAAARVRGAAGRPILPAISRSMSRGAEDARMGPPGFEHPW